MTSFARAALAALAVSISIPAMAAQQQAQQPAQNPTQQRAAKDYKLTKEVRQFVGEAQKLNAAGDGNAALAQLQQALPRAKTADDRYVIGTVMIEVGGKLNNVQLQEQGVDLAISSGALPAADVPKFQFFAGRFAFARGDYAKALTAFNAARTGGYQDPQLVALIADASFKSNNNGGGLATLRQAVEAEVAAGRKPDENWLKRGVSAAYQAKQADELAWWTQQQIRAYPSPQNWRTALVTYRDGANLDPQAELDLMRLMRATKSLQGKRDYYDYANTATNRGLNGEVVAVIDEGAASGTFTRTEKGFGELYKLASGKAASDRAGLAREAAAADKSAAATDAVAVADAYLGYKDYANAAKYYQAALGKTGVDANLVNTRLGIALALAGQKAEAKAALAKVTGPRQGVANYWSFYVDQTA